jgi:hypothetical protein
MDQLAGVRSLATAATVIAALAHLASAIARIVHALVGT